MKRSIKLLYTYTLFILSLGSACTHQNNDNGNLTDPSSTQLISISQEQKRKAQIETGLLETRDLSSYVVTNGYFDVPPQNKAQISSFKAGYIKSTKLLVGDRVKKGEVVIVLENPDYVKLQQQYMEVKGQLEYLKAEYERKKILEQEKITAQKNLQKARADYQSAQARFKGLEKELQLMGTNLRNLERGQYSTTISIRSPIEGTVTKVSTAMGKYVLPHEVLLELVNTDHLHVELEVFEKDIMKIREGQSIRIRIPNLSDKEYLGEVYLVGKALDPDTRSIHVHGHIPKEETFVPGMYVEADIIVDTKKVPALPQGAIWSAEDGQYIFLEVISSQSGSDYRKVKVETGMISNDWVEVIPLETISNSARVVYKGGYYLTTATGGS